MKKLHIKLILLFLFFATFSTFAQVQKKKVMLKKIEFVSATRGYQESVVIEKKTMEIKQSGATPRDEKVKIRNADWKVFCNIVQQVDLKKMDKLKAPSEKSHVDAARASHFSITTSKGKFDSVGFDNYDAPNELMPLLKRLVASAKLKK